MSRQLLASASIRTPRRALRRPHEVTRLRCLYNGYILTIDPAKALSPASAADRYRLWVLHALLVDPDTGKVAAIFPPMGQPDFAGGPMAQPVSTYASLRNDEQPRAPGLTAAQVLAYWRRAGVDTALLDGAEWLDLQGAVVTPGLTDTHFHVSSWSKKVPPPGQRFGYWADLSDPAYYVDPSDMSALCARDSMWRIVADANRHLLATSEYGIFLHGYQYGEIDSDSNGLLQPTFCFASSPSSEDRDPNPTYVLNRVGARAVTPPADPCHTDPAAWPLQDYPALPALLVHTTGQSCWYNVALLESYNQRQAQIGAALDPVTLAAATATGAASGDLWLFTFPPGVPDADLILAARAPFTIDLEASPPGGGDALTVPFEVLESDATARTLTVQALIPDLATAALATPPASLKLKPFYRPIVECIPKASWDAALAFWGEEPASDPVSYGQWDPRDPYATNWYNGAKRGLIQYFFDDAAQAWRPTGYAEHYPMRDALATVVATSPTTEQLVEQRRVTAAWCHRHGLTMVNDIMFYRRDGQGFEFSAYEALSFDHKLAGDATFNARIGLHPTTATGGFNLRTGLYYYVETGDDVDDTLRIAHDATAGSDLDLLRPPADHPEYPGWVRWLGWKLQLDGAAATRNAFTNAPLAKARLTDPVAVINEHGNTVTFLDHSYGLLTMTDLQEQVFTSRESAALYWLVRESDPSSAFHNAQMQRDWSVLGRGVVNLLGTSVDGIALTADLENLGHVTLSPTQRSQLAAKIAAVVEQLNDGWGRTLSAIIRIWFERSRSPVGLPPLPSQTVCHVSGDSAVDLWARAIKQLRDDVTNLPLEWSLLPPRWQAVVPQNADQAAIRRTFSGERFRMEHLVSISKYMLDDITGTGGLDALTTPLSRNVALTLQPSIMATDGGTGAGFPPGQELWPVPHTAGTWNGLAAIPRYHHFDSLATLLARDIPFSINTDPPAMRDPRPALTVLGAVTRTPLEIDPAHWADQTGPEPAVRPPDYLAGKVYAPFGLVAGASTNPMQLTIEQALAAMTFWGAYCAGMEGEVGALAVPADSGQPGWFADLVVWRRNPLAIKGPGGLTLEELARTPAGTADEQRLATINAFISKFLPRLAVVSGVKVFEASVPS